MNYIYIYILSEFTMKNSFSWNVTPYNLVQFCRHSRGSSCHHHFILSSCFIKFYFGFILTSLISWWFMSWEWCISCCINWLSTGVSTQPQQNKYLNIITLIFCITFFTGGPPSQTAPFRYDVCLYCHPYPFHICYHSASSPTFGASAIHWLSWWRQQGFLKHQ